MRLSTKYHPLERTTLNRTFVTRSLQDHPLLSVSYALHRLWLLNVHHNIVHPLSFFFRRPELLCGRLCRSLR